MNLPAKLELYIVSADPGLVGLRMGGRITLTVASVCLALLVLGHWLPMDSPAYVIGLITAIQGAAQINDPTVKDRAVTRAYAALCGFIAIAGISVAGNSAAVTDVWVLIVVFLATYATRFGPRWQAVGVFSFMCCVMAAFLQAPERDLTEIAVALIVSGIVAHLVREYVMPERPARDFRRVVDGTISVSQKLREVIEAVRATPKDVPWDDALLVLSRLRTDIRMCQSYLMVAAEGPEAEWNSAIMLRLLDLQLAAEGALDAVSAGQQRQPRADTDGFERELDAIKEAERRLHLAVAELPTSLPDGGVARRPMPRAKPFPARGEWLKDEQLRLALQVTLACAIAIVGGRLISSDRWFWAVMTAFLIFMNTQSSGAVAVRAVSRGMGTLAGIVLGIALATLVSGDKVLALALIGISIFAAFYLARISYTAMSLLINVAISLIYGLVGIFTPQLLILRLEETAIGAAAGIFASLALLPIRTAHKADQAMNRFYLSLKQLIEAVSDVTGEHREKSMTAAASAVDKSFGDVMRAYSPMRSFWTMRVVEAKTRSPLRRAYLLAHAAHLLEHSFRNARPTDAELQELAALRDRLGAVTEKAGSKNKDQPSASAEGPLADYQVDATISDDSTRYGMEILSEALRDIENEDSSPGVLRRAAG